MAIFGNFTDIPLPDVLSMVGQSIGTFSVWNHPSNHFYQLHLNSSSLRAMEIDGVSVTEVLEIRTHIIGLMSSQEGDFEFVKKTSGPEGPLRLPLEQILLSGLTAIDEIAAFSDHLPSEDTFFKFSGRTDVFLDETLGVFWEQCGYYLLNGASSRIIQTQTGFELNDIRLQLYKLRSLGLIVPSRCFEAAAVSETASQGKAEDAGRTLEELSPIWEGEESELVREENDVSETGYSLLPLIISPAPEKTKIIEVTSLQSVQIGKTSQPILRNILGHLQTALGFKSS